MVECCGGSVVEKCVKECCGEVLWWECCGEVL